MALEVEIVSRETIKPSSPTPQDLSIFKLSLLDQVASKRYVPLVLFYSTSMDQTHQSSDRFRQSLSETLTHMYPLAGRIQDMFTINCKDQGVEYIETRVSNNMSLVLNHPKIELLQQLLPCPPQDIAVNPSDQILLKVQVNYFDCGGTAIGVCVNHIIADFSGISTFLKTWAAIARGENKIVGNFVVDCTTMFPPQDVSDFTNPETLLDKGNKTKAKRFIFSGSNIAALKEKATKSESCAKPPSRVVAVSTFIWASIIEANRGGIIKNWHMSILLNLRNRMMNPPISRDSIGNIVHGTSLRWESVGDSVDYGALVKLVKDSIDKVDADYARKVYGDVNYYNTYKAAVSAFVKYNDKMAWFNITSWCRFPIYEVDFGLGKPIWAGTAFIPKDIAIFIDTSDGEGIEAWVNLSEEYMNKLEQNPEFLVYVSSSQSL